jgi:diaminopimelate decarboxylase
VHIGSENTALAWQWSAQVWLDILEQFPDIVTFDMWGGFKEVIMPYETSADLQEIGKSVAETFRDFEKKTWRKIHLEIEPGKALVINSGSVIAKVDDIVDTWVGWHTFIRTNTGMTEMPRPSMYGIQQTIIIVNESKNQKKYVVVGHCCESWDLLTPKLYHNEMVEELELAEARIWDTIVFDGVWAYSSSMSMKHYNSFPEAGELMLLQDWEIKEIRKRQQPEDVWKNEVLI